MLDYAVNHLTASREALETETLRLTQTLDYHKTNPNSVKVAKHLRAKIQQQEQQAESLDKALAILSNEM